MREIFYLTDTPANKISYYHLLAFLCSLPFDMFYSELILASLFLHTLIHSGMAGWRSINFKTMLPALIYLPTMLCIFYTTDSTQAFKDLEKQLALLLFPLIFSITNLDIKKYKTGLLKGFGITCLLVTIYFYYDALHIIYLKHLPGSTIYSSAFTNHNFSAPLDLHATYFSMYCSISIITFIYLLANTQKTGTRILYLFSVACLMAGVFQLSSKSVLITLLLIINFIIPFFPIRRISRNAYITFTGLSSVIIIILFFSLGSFKQRFVDTLKADFAIHDRTLQNGSYSRAKRWKLAFQLIREAPLFGKGSGSEGKILQEKYFETHLYEAYLHQLNAHNEYISLMLKFGIPGAVCYIFILYSGIKIAIQKKDTLFCSFIILIAVVSLSENILDVNKGIFFFSFFFTFFWFNNLDKEIIALGNLEKTRILHHQYADT